MAGFVPYRKHQFGRQSSFGTPIVAQRAYPFTGVPDVNLNWTDPEGDFGSIDPIAKPYRVAPDLTANLTDNALAYNNLRSCCPGSSVEPYRARVARPRRGPTPRPR